MISLLKKLWLPVLLLLVLSAVKAGEAFVVEGDAPRLQDGAYLLNVEIQYHFSEVVLKALESGVPLTVDVQIQVRRKGAWIWESDIVHLVERRQLRFQPLSGIYEVRYLNGHNKKNFVTRTAAIEALGSIENYQVVEKSRLTPGETYIMKVATSLDIEALPVPLRPTAYLSSDWNLSSEWHEWLLKP